MEDFEKSKSDCSVESNKLSPMRTMINVRDQSSRQHGPPSVPPSSGSNIGEADTEKASCMRSASLENRKDTSIIPPEYTSSIFSVSPPSLIKWTRNIILSASISNRQPAFKKAFPTAGKSKKDEATTSVPPELKDVENRTSAFSAYDDCVSTVKLCPRIEKNSLTPAPASNTGVSVGRLRETSEKPDACDTPVGSRRPIRQNSDSSNVMAQKQDQCKLSKCKTPQRCQFCPKEFKNVSELRKHERVHTGDRPFKCDVCGMSFSQAGNLCAHKRTHTGDRPHKCNKCGRSFKRSSNLRRHERIHSA